VINSISVMYQRWFEWVVAAPSLMAFSDRIIGSALVVGVIVLLFQLAADCIRVARCSAETEPLDPPKCVLTVNGERVEVR